MSVKPDWWIREQCQKHQMILPYVEELVSRVNGKKVVSWGLASSAYDARLGSEFLTYNNSTHPLDPMDVKDFACFSKTCSEFILMPGAFVLATTFETFIIPRNVVATVAEKSTYKRCGISVGNTRLEPGWRGQVTLEIKNDNPDRSVILRSGEGIVAIEFHELSASDYIITTQHECDVSYADDYVITTQRECDVSYADRKGKYQDQIGVTLAKG